MTTTLNGLVCEGLTLDKVNVKDCFGSDQTKCDVDKTLRLTLKDTSSVTFPETEAGAIAQCRSMYDENKLSYKYCCQQVDVDSKIAGFIAEGVKTSEGPGALTADNAKVYKFGAEAFNNAKALGGAMLSVAGAVVMMQ